MLRTGIDIVEVERITKMIREQGDRFLSRCFTDEERAECERRPARFVHYAGKFAAKEAVYKVLGIEWKGAFSWKHISIEKKEGRPVVSFRGSLKDVQSRLRVEISISHSRQYAVAVAVSDAISEERIPGST